MTVAALTVFLLLFPLLSMKRYLFQTFNANNFGDKNV